MRSIRARLNLGILALFSVIFVVSGFAIHAQIERGLYQEAALAIDEAQLRDTLASVRRVLVATGLLGLAATALTLLFVVRAGLAPLGELHQELAVLDATRPEARLELQSSVAELDPIVARLNELMQRMRGEFERERSFSSDVSHELRTPLTGLRLTLELLLARPREGEDLERGLRDCLDTTRQMQALVLRLFDFARAERPTLELEQVDPRRLIEEIWQASASRASERGLTLRIQGEACEPWTTDRVLLERVVANLVDNALEYADRDSPLEVRVQAGARGGLALRFTNASKNTRGEDGARVLDAFWRADETRSAGEHCGLGLSLTRRIIQRLGGTIRARTETGRFTIELELPDAAGLG